MWKSNHRGSWRDAAHGELLGSTLAGWNTFDPQGVSLVMGTLGKKHFDACGGLLADSRTRVLWTSTSSSFLWEHFVGFATVPTFGDRDAAQLKMFGLVMAGAAAPPRCQLKTRNEDADFASGSSNDDEHCEMWKNNAPEIGTSVRHTGDLARTIP